MILCILSLYMIHFYSILSQSSKQTWQYSYWTLPLVIWIISDTPSQDAFCKFLGCRLDCTSCLLHRLLYDETKQNCDMGCVETLPLPIRTFINRQAWNAIPSLIRLAGPSRLSALFVFSPFFRIFEWLPLPVPLKLKLAPTCTGTNTVFTLLCA